MEKSIDWMAWAVKGLFAILFIFSINSLKAQEVKKISFQAEGISIEQAIQQIGNQTGFAYSFNPSIFSNHPKIYCNFKKQEPAIIFKKIISDPSIGIRQLQTGFVFYQKQPINVNLTGTIKNYRTAKGVEQVRLSIKQENTSTITNENGEYQFSFGSYLDSFEVYIFHKDFDEKKVKIQATAIQLNLSLMPIPEYYSFLPHIKYEPLYQPTASIEKNFLVKAFVSNDLIENEPNNTETLKSDSSSVETLNNKTPFYAPFQFGLVPPLNNHKLNSGWAINNISFNAFSGYSYGTEGVEFASFLNIVRKDVKGLQFAGFGNLNGGKTDGVQFGGFFNYSHQQLNGFHFSGFSNTAGKHVYGGQFSGFLNISRGETIGIQAAGFSNITSRDFKGIQLSGFHNTTAGSFMGIQAAGFLNTSSRRFYGIQAAGFLNVHAGKFNGIQAAGFSNVSGDVNGIQFAPFLNIGMKVNGMQIGIINYADSINGLTIGVINIVKNGLHKFELAYNEMGMASLAFKTGSYGFHNIFYGALETNQGKKDWGVGYGFGSMIFGTKKVQLSASAISIQLSQNGKFYNGINLLNRASVSLGIEVNKGLDLFFSPTFNVLVREPSANNLAEATFEIAPFDFSRKPSQDPDASLQSWVGFEVGFRF